MMNGPRYPSPPQFVAYRSASPTHMHPGGFRAVSPRQVPGSTHVTAHHPAGGRAGAPRQAGALADSMRVRMGAGCVRTAQMVYGGGYASPRAQSPGRSSSPTGLFVSPVPQPPAAPPDVMVFSAFNTGIPPAQTSPRYPSPVQQRPYTQHPPHPVHVHQQVPAAHAWRRAGPSETEMVVYRSMSPNSIMPAGTGERGRAPVRHRHPSPDYCAGRYATVERPAARYARLRNAMLLATRDTCCSLSMTG